MKILIAAESRVTFSPIDRNFFYDKIRSPLFKGTITTSQFKGMEAVLNEWDRLRLEDHRHLAYMLATDFHETAKTMQPIEEYSKGRGRDYGKKLKMGGGPGKRIRYENLNVLFFGRGKVQLTWYENYLLMGRLLGIDLLNNPELALQMDIAVQIMFEGMLKAASSFGDFTGRCLEQYFNTNTNDPINARKIINGLDCALSIAEIHRKFLAALR